MPILLMLGMLFFAYIGLHFLAAILTSIIPSTDFLFHDNKIALIIFSLSLFCGFPVFICLPIALIAGVFFAKIWYVPALQYITLEIMLAVLSLVATLIFGAGSTITDMLKKKNK